MHNKKKAGVCSGITGIRAQGYYYPRTSVSTSMHTAIKAVTEVAIVWAPDPSDLGKGLSLSPTAS